MRILDAHHHLWPEAAIEQQVWRPEDDAPLARAFETAEYAKLRNQAGVQGSIVMQSVDSAAENQRLLDYVQEDPALVGAVPWVPVPEPAQARSVLEDLQQQWAQASLDTRMVGVRCLIGAEEIGWALSPAGLDLFRHLAAQGLTWDVVPITAAQRRALAELAQRVPNLRIVIDHMAAPPLDREHWEHWRKELQTLAAQPNIAVKLCIGVAVLDQMAGWDPDFLHSAFEAVLEAVGPQRAMLGSNWPVVELQTDYVRAWEDSRNAVQQLLSPAEQPWALGGAAAHWYALDQG